MNRKILSLTAVLAFGLSACGTPEGDLQEFCTIVETVLADESKKGNEEFAIGKQVSMNLKTDEVMDLLKSVSKSSPKKAYKKLLKGAKKLGVEGYKCKAAKKYWKAQSKKKKKKKK